MMSCLVWKHLKSELLECFKTNNLYSLNKADLWSVIWKEKDPCQFGQSVFVKSLRSLRD